MEYKYAKNCNYEDFASGRVLYGIGGLSNFPVRLANEIYGRCLQYLNKKEDICLYDCCCGGAYSLTVLGFLNQRSISRIIASDIDNKMLETARLNLSLLSEDGMKRRIDELNLLYKRFNKESHREAIESAIRLLNMIQKEISVQVFRANALQGIEIDVKPDIIITDVPYGNLVDWQEGTGGVSRLLDSLAEICGKETVIAVSMNKDQKIDTTSFRRLEKQNVGKRRFEIYKPA